MRLDLGRLAPEDALLDRIVHELKTAMRITRENSKKIVFTDLDWAVEKDPAGITIFDQSAYLARATLLLDRSGFRPTVTVANGDFDRLGLGVAYRRTCQCPPMTYRPKTLLVKPAWLCLANVLQWRRQMEPVADIAIQDVQAGTSWCLLYKRNDGVPVAVVWRNDEQGLVSWDQTGYEVIGADDVFGAPVAAEKNGYPVGKVPVRFALKPSAEPPAEALTRIRVRSAAGESTWPQMTLAAFAPATGAQFEYKPTGGTATNFDGDTPYGETAQRSGLKFAPAGSESFAVTVPAGSGLILRKGYFLDDAGQQADVLLDGQPAGAWNLLRAEKELSGGLREAIFVVEPQALAGKTKVTVELRYPKGGNTTHWVALEYHGGDCPLTAVGPIHANQNVGAPRPGRNIVGSGLKINDKPFANGLGCFAPSLQEYALNRQFKRFTADVGVDAATEGKGSVVFEIYGDGKKLWNSPVMSGLDAAKSVDLPVAGIDRLRLVVTDAGDGNRYDAADWCNATLHLR